MKKLLTICLLFVLVSCASFAGGNKESQNLLDDLQGTWKQVDGKSVITITGNDFTILNMEIGYAGYGIVSIVTLKGTKFLRFETFNKSTPGAIMYLGWTEAQLNAYKEGYDWHYKDKLVINDFQMKAWEEFSLISEKNNERFPDHIIEKYFSNIGSKLGFNEKPFNTDGTANFHFELNEDNLKISQENMIFNYVEEGYLIYILFTGYYERIK
ncbi:MAG: hypothetical protein FWC19_00140 [Treponema sp.]|nr:hypothetical protein [Treponema sp.]